MLDRVLPSKQLRISEMNTIWNKVLRNYWTINPSCFLKCHFIAVPISFYTSAHTFKKSTFCYCLTTNQSTAPQSFSSPPSRTPYQHCFTQQWSSPHSSTSSQRIFWKHHWYRDGWPFCNSKPQYSPISLGKYLSLPFRTLHASSSFTPVSISVNDVIRIIPDGQDSFKTVINMRINPLAYYSALILPGWHWYHHTALSVSSSTWTTHSPVAPQLVKKPGWILPLGQPEALPWEPYWSDPRSDIENKIRNQLPKDLLIIFNWSRVWNAGEGSTSASWEHDWEK